MRMGIIADIHGNDVALRAVLRGRGSVCGAARQHRQVRPDRRAARPARYLADAAGSIDLMERYAAMAAGTGWTRGVDDRFIGGIRVLNPR